MQTFHTHRGRMALLDQSNIDTDQIIPKQFLKNIERTGYGENLFYNWRYTVDGKPNSMFALNRPEYEGASILITRSNFGCGSSREHAVWALMQYGFRVVIAEETTDSPAFADIFRGNAIKNGLLLISLPSAKLLEIAQMLRAEAPLEASVELPSQTILVRSRQKKVFIGFDFPNGDKEILLKGLDDIALTLQHADQISAFEQTHSI